MTNRVSILNNGHDPYIGDNGCKLSGGELQRFNIIRSLLREASIYIFDEPTHYLDEESKKILFEKLRELRENNKTVIIITHD